MRKINMISVVTTVFCLVGFMSPAVVLAASPAPINLGTAGNFEIVAKTGVSTTGSTVVVGDIGISPAAATYITGFGLILPAASSYSTSALVSGKIYAPGYADPTPSVLTTAVLDMQNAYTDGSGRASSVTELGAGNIGGLTLAPGVYKWGTSVTIPTDVTLSGGANDVWIFVVAQNLTVSAGTRVVLSGGAQPNNIFWVVGGQTTIGTSAVFNGNILDQTAIVLNTGATLNGRALAQSAVTLDSNSLAIPTGTSVMYTPPPASIPMSVQNSVQVNQSSNNTTQSNYTNSTPSYYSQPAAQTVYQGGDFLPARDASGNLLAPTNQMKTPTFPNSGQTIGTVGANLTTGSSGMDVAILQQFLISQNLGPSARALANVGASSHFGALTRSALAEFQASVGISPAIGNFGPITRGYISAHY